MRDAARIVHEVLVKHANGPDPAMAAAARAELAYRHQRDREALLAAGRAIQESIARTASAMAAVAGRIVAAFGGADALREVVRRREQGECVAHDTPGVPAVTEYDGDRVCEDCAVAYLVEDIEELEPTDG